MSTITTKDITDTSSKNVLNGITPSLTYQKLRFKPNSIEPEYFELDKHFWYGWSNEAERLWPL